ncbi:MAG: hypothetical protein ACYTEZ_05745 [Planctomycetota bacterium]|jgi:HEAT repeat protein
MRARALGVALVLVACGESEPSVAERIDALRASAEPFFHPTLPTPQRLAGLFPDGVEIERDPRRRLRENDHGRAILDAGERAVPELIRLLDSPPRRTLAAVLLAEIGGREAAAALLGRWRDLRGAAKTKSIYDLEGRPPCAAGGGYRHEGVDHDFYRELIEALCHAGRPVAAAVAADTDAAMDESERRHAMGKDLARDERRREPRQEIELRWHVECVETASEGLQMLARVGAPEAPPRFVRALHSPVHALRWTAVQCVTYLGRDAESVLLSLGILLDDPGLRFEALDALVFLLDGRGLPRTLKSARREDLVRRYKERLRELGHLPP